jgi:hypothetical protein
MARCARHCGRGRLGLHVPGYILLWFTPGRNPDVTAGTRLRLKDSSLIL